MLYRQGTASAVILRGQELGMLRNIPPPQPPWQGADEARRVGGGREGDQWSGDIAPPSWLEGSEDSDCSDVFCQSSLPNWFWI